MGIITKTFKSGNSVAVRLPKELGIVEGTELEIERTGDTVTIRPKHKKTMGDLVEALRKIGPPPGPKLKRQKIVFPQRRGL
jgi:antitoxin VapB